MQIVKESEATSRCNNLNVLIWV